MVSSRVTIADIARLAGVSKATVSYVLNSRDSGFRISEETSRKVLEICQEQNYRPDQAAVQLSQCRKVPLNLLVASPWLYSQFSDFMCQLNLVLHRYEHSARLKVSYVSFTPGEVQEVLKSSGIRRFDAVLVVGTDGKDNEWLEKHSGELPKVVLMKRQVEGILSCSGNDFKAIAGLNKVVDFNHYHRFVVMVPLRHSLCENLRCSGFAALCESKKQRAENIEVGDYSDFWTALRPEIEKDGSLLVFCPQYVPAALILKEAVASRVDVPHRLGIVAYDRHSLLDRFMSPQLTSIDPRLELMAERTLELIFGIRESKRQQSQIVKAEVVSGGTTVNKVKIVKE